MKKFYLLPLLLFLTIKSIGQSCSLAVSYTSSESRCMATGSITVNVTGGSGNYNFKAIGPVTTPATSSNQLTGLAPGNYTIWVKDLTSGCIKTLDNAHVNGSYSDPRFQLTKTDASCAGNDGTVSVLNQQFGRSPFLYSIIAPSPSGIGTISASGNFTGLVAGEYVIQLRDSCGGIQVRRITIENYSWWFDSVAVNRIGCDSASVFLRVKDNKGNVNTVGTAFNGFLYGYVIGTDTTWSSSNNFKLLIGKRRSLTLVVKDRCGAVHATVWNLPANLKPSLGSVALTNLACSTLTASVTGQNFTNPQYCLYENGLLVNCNSTGTFANIGYGSYCIEAYDACYDTLIQRCFTAVKPAANVSSSVQITNRQCSTFTATITGQQNLYSPLYCLFDVNDVVIICNSNGIFNNLPYGSYCIRTHDQCSDTMITRCFTVSRPVATLTSTTISGLTCTSFNVSTTGSNLNGPTYCLYDNLGNVIACNSTGVFTGLNFGSYCIRAISCGDTTNSLCFTGVGPVASVAGSVQISNKQCSTFTAAITGQTNLTNPQYCIYDAADVLINCNTTGVFPGLAYGSYCIKVYDSCLDTTIVRCFSQAQTKPSIASTIQLLSSTCNTISIKVSGSNLSSPTYCLYDSVDALVVCNATGTFNNIPYGRYCATITDGCIDTTMRVCQSFAPVKGVSLTTSKSCTIGNANVNISFQNNNAPYSINIYHPDGSLVHSTTTSSNPYSVQLPGLPAGTQYKVVGADNCGNMDSASIAPDANIVTKSISVRAKCPSSTWLNGAGDLLATVSSTYYAVIPQIIKKDGVDYVKSYSSVTGSVYTFADLEPADYVVEYKQQTCNTKVYDTVTVPPYAYPSQGQSAIYQCDNNSFGLGADVSGGVTPFTFQIIGSMPDLPSIMTSPQASPVFNINTGTTYSLVRLRSVDACGNATLSDVSVLPLQNISVSASDICFYQNIVLSVDTIPNAIYTWYKKITPVDSVLLGTGLIYNLPFFVPEQIGDYICKVVVNNGCITRQSHFIMDGNCGAVLPAGLRLQGKRLGNLHQLTWNNADEGGVLKYVVERKTNGSYAAIGSAEVHSGKAYLFNDNSPLAGLNYYRLKLLYANKVAYSNIITLNASADNIVIYPNPAKDKVNISISANKPGQYRIQVLTATGEIVYTNELRNTLSTTFVYTRKKGLPPGMYIIRIKNVDANTTEIRKLLFE